MRKGVKTTLILRIYFINKCNKFVSTLLQNSRIIARRKLS